MSSSALDTPMMRQYIATKAQYPDAILLYRMGDFYEMFLDDAVLAAPLLEIALTTRDKNKPDPVPMCGIPVHAADGHIKRLAELGHCVAICEQTEDPKQAGGRRLVKREVVEVVTPGLVGDPSGIASHAEVSVVALATDVSGFVGLACLDASTGDFRATRIASGDEALLPPAAIDELVRLSPRELLVAEARKGAVATLLRDLLPRTAITGVASESFDPSSAPVQPAGFEAKSAASEMCAAAALLGYLGRNQPFALDHAPRLRPYGLQDHVILDAATRAHLELFENSEDRARSGTLIEQVDATVTPLGARLLARWLAYPLLSPEEIRARGDAVAFLFERDRPRASLRDALRGVRDLERLFSKAARPGATPRDLGLLRASLAALPGVQTALEGAQSAAGSDDELMGASAPTALEAPEPIPGLQQLLAEGLIDDPPVVARGSRGANETGYIREAFRPELDLLRESAVKGREWIAGLEARERERTGIAHLKARYHPVHGYSLEVSKAQLSRVPEDYERKQTLASVERFTTKELREVEGKVMGASERAAALEREILESLRQEVVAAAEPIREAAGKTACLDATAALAEVARRRAWVRPVVDSSTRLEIRAGRHPVVEALAARGRGDSFVPNDTDLDSDEVQLLLLTGPNMSGKSTYLRQVALIVLLAQMGSFVPAEAARIGAVDRVFTRVGASDRLARGESTFMVEMRETSEILRQASPRSLVILDEIGRGTSTFDGLSIAWSVAEYLHETPGLAPRTLFATHYHELTDLARTLERVENAHFDVREWDEEVVFLRQLVPGGASRSYGIQVARLAGLPDAVVDRAKEILANLEGGELDAQGRPRLAHSSRDERAGEPRPARAASDQLALVFQESADPAERAVLETIRALEPETMTPIDALSLLDRLRRQLEGGGRP